MSENPVIFNAMDTRKTCSIEALESAAPRIRKLVASLIAKYPRLRGAYAVIASGGQQFSLGASTEEAFTQAPKLFGETEHHRIATQHLGELTDLRETLKTTHKLREKERLANAIASIQKKLRARLLVIRIFLDLPVELRFDELHYETLRLLGQDPMIARDLTPQTDASIVVVLGTLGEFV